MLIYIIVFIVLFIPSHLHPTKIINKKNMPKKGNKCIVASNHFSMWDPVFYDIFFARRFKAVAKKELFKNKLFGFILKCLGAIPIDREKMTPSSLKEILGALDKKEQIVIYPEGTRNKTEEDDLQGAKTGLVIFASKGECPIVPVVIYKKPKLFRKNYMIVGEPFYVEGENPKRLTKEEINKNVERYVAIMADLRNQIDEYVASKHKNKKNKK